MTSIWCTRLVRKKIAPGMRDHIDLCGELATKFYRLREDGSKLKAMCPSHNLIDGFSDYSRLWAEISREEYLVAEVMGS